MYMMTNWYDNARPLPVEKNTNLALSWTSFFCYWTTTSRIFRNFMNFDFEFFVFPGNSFANDYDYEI